MLTPMKTVEKMILGDCQRRTKAISNIFCIAGELCVTKARNEGSYKDRTGNLRSSIGYTVTDNGKVIKKGGLQTVGSGSQGATEGSRFMQELINQNKKGIVLIVCAGMNYSLRVEAKGYDVLASSELFADQLSNQMLNSLGFKIR